MWGINRGGKDSRRKVELQGAYCDPPRGAEMARTVGVVKTSARSFSPSILSGSSVKRRDVGSFPDTLDREGVQGKEVRVHSGDPRSMVWTTRIDNFYETTLGTRLPEGT